MSTRGGAFWSFLVAIGSRSKLPSAPVAARTGLSACRPRRRDSGSHELAPAQPVAWLLRLAAPRPEARLPCGVQPRRNSWLSLVSVLAPSGPRPVVDGNMRPESSASRRASVSTSIAREASGTRCSRLAFMRSAGTIQTRPSRSTSDQRASRASPDRLAVKVTNANNSFAAGLAFDSRTVRNAVPTSRWGRAR